jgi:hypothetical protein
VKAYNMFDHFVMTRFNMSSGGKEQSIRLKPGWLEHRFSLFEDYCLPSVLAQTCKDFRWIIYFDIDTPRAFRDRADRLARPDSFVPFYTPYFPAEGWRNSLTDTFAPKSDFVLTTRLDNDDSLSRDFVERLHAAVRQNGCAEGAYNFTSGLIRHGRAIYRISHTANAFSSQLERNTPAMVTAPAIHHMKIAEAGPVFQIGGAPAWLQIVHDRNVSNKVRGFRVADADLGARFAGKGADGLSAPGSLAVILENATLGLWRAARDMVADFIRGQGRWAGRGAPRP